jgi:hypothetical protein
MPPLNDFVKADGSFDTAAYIRWLAVHPHHWWPTVVLGRNSARASLALCNWLQQNLRTGLRPAKVVTLNEAEYLKN